MNAHNRPPMDQNIFGIPPIVVALSGLLATFLLMVFRTPNVVPGKKIPTEWGSLVVGSFYDIIPTKVLETFRKFIKENGSMVEYFIHGRRHLLVADKAVFHEMVTERARLFRKSRKFDDAYALLKVDNTLMQQNVISKFYRGSRKIPLIISAAEALINKLASPDHQSVHNVDIYPHLSSYSLSLTVDVLFGSETIHQNSTFAQYFHSSLFTSDLATIREYLSQYALQGMLPTAIWRMVYPFESRALASIQRLDQIILAVIEQKLADQQTRDDNNKHNSSNNSQDINALTSVPSMQAEHSNEPRNDNSSEATVLDTGYDSSDYSLFNRLREHINTKKQNTLDIANIIATKPTTATASSVTTTGSTITTTSIRSSVHKKIELLNAIKSVLLFGTVQTTAVSVCWILYQLAQDSELVERMRGELERLPHVELNHTPFSKINDNTAIDNSSNNNATNSITKESVSADMALKIARFITDHNTTMPFTYGVICESIRLNPSEPLLNLQTESSTAGVKLRNDTHIKPDDEIVISADHIMRNDEVYTDAANFHPTRWLTKNKDVQAAMHTHLVPFGEEANKYTNTTHDLTEIVLTIAAIVLRFNITFDNKQSKDAVIRNMSDTSGYVAEPVGLRFTFTERHNG